MKHEKASFDVLSKIQQERIKRGWTEYTLAKNSELSQSTISSWYRKDLEPYRITRVLQRKDVTGDGRLFQNGIQVLL